MRALLLLSAVLLLGVSSAEAACTCVCENGKAQAQCASVLQKPPVCPASTCVATDKRTPAMPNSSACKLERAINPENGRIETRRVCK